MLRAISPQRESKHDATDFRDERMIAAMMQRWGGQLLDEQSGQLLHEQRH